ncbi:MAG: sigma-54-dependent Fis family transcriptional regulator [Deltaproteobacteria bacterium]|nr:sigma-54-dependent Fis family transcriptional regulator [Deltaproteobacteria bacterium]
MNRFSVFVVDDEESIREGVSRVLERKYRVRSFRDAETAVEAVRELAPDLVLLDVGLPGMSGIEALAAMKRLHPDIAVIVITAYEDVPTVVSAMKGGAFDYMVKPIYPETLEVSVGNALESVRLKKEVRELQEKSLRENVPLFIGKSDAVQDVMVFVESVAKSPDTPILVVGETGTGKELVAGAIHFRSPNFRGPLVGVNCAAIPKELIESELFGYEKGAFTGASPGGKKGLVEQAAGGTLFLDEVGDLSMEAQAKLLRFLEEGEFYRVGGTRKLKLRVRVVSATNKDLGELTSRGLFREDLYYRLAVVKIVVPSLNERREDILPIAAHFLVEFSGKFAKPFTSISTGAGEFLKSYRWKGNVRELKNIIERAVLVGKGPELTLDDLGFLSREAPAPAAAATSGSFPIPSLTEEGIDFPSLMDSFERHFFREALRLSGGNETRAASFLGLNHHTFRYRRRKLEE